MLWWAAWVASAQTVSVFGGCPGRVSLTVECAPGATVDVLAAEGPGDARLDRGPCEGSATGLESPRRVARTTDHDGDGRIRVRPALSEPACGAHLVAIDTSTCTASPRARVGATGTLWAADGRGGGMPQLYRIDLDTGGVEAVAALDHAVTSLAVAPDGTWWAGEASARAPRTRLSTLDPDTGELTTVLDSELFGWSGLAFDAEGRMLRWTEALDSLVLVDPDSGVEAPIYASPSASHCLTADAEGTVYRYYNGWIYRVDPVAGTEEWLGTPPGLAYGRQGIGCTFHRGLLYVTHLDADDPERQLVAVDLEAWTAAEVHVWLPDTVDALASPTP